jgi:hypothetical protein
MSKAGKLVKDIVKAKKESVMGKLGDSPYEDPMEPWSAKYQQPVKEEALNEDGLLMKYIKSLGFNPEFMSFTQRSSYARSNAFKHYKQSHEFGSAKTNLKQEDVSEETEHLDEAGTGLLMSFIKSKGLNPLAMDGNQKKAYSRSSEFRIFKMRHMKEVSGMGERGDDWNEEKKPVKEEADAKDTVTMDIPLLIRVLEYAREDAKTDMDLHKVVENLINMRGEGALSMDMYNKIVAIKEEIERIDELKSTTLQSYKTAAHKSLGANAVARQAGEISSKEYHATANKRSKGINRADADKRLGTYADKTPKKLDISAHGKHIQKQYHSEEVQQVDELSSDLLGRYKKAAGAQASAADKSGDYAKGNKRFSGIMKATKKQFDNDSKKINELKKQNDNGELDSHITREDLRKWFSKTDPEGDWKRINSKGEVAGPCAREPGEPKPKCMSKEKRAELSKSERAAAVATKRKHDPVADRAGKGGKPINVSNYGKGKLSEDEVDEACWDTHKKVGMKMKGGKMVPDCRPKNEEVVTEGAPIAVAEAEKNPHTSALGKALYRDLSKEKKASPAQVQRNKERWAKRQAEREQGVAEGAPIAVALAPIDVRNPKKSPQPYRNQGDIVPPTKPSSTEKRGVKGRAGQRPMPTYEEAEQMDEKNSPTNPSLWSRAKSMARSKFDVYPSAYANGWASKWYKSKGGGWKSVKEDVVQEGIGGIEDSPMSATNSVKAMESEQRKKNMKSARIIKSIYKKKGKNESMYDWEKTDKGGKTPTAKITLQGGTTMTGKPRDTVEIEPVLKTRPNSQKQ